MARALEVFVDLFFGTVLALVGIVGQEKPPARRGDGLNQSRTLWIIIN